MALLPSGCASGRTSGAAWVAGMMGVMVAGGAILGTKGMHSRLGAGSADSTFVQRYNPSLLLEQRQALELAAVQVSDLEALREDVAAGRRSAAEAARAAYELLRPVQRLAAEGAPPPSRAHY